MLLAALACALGAILLAKASVLFVDGAASLAARLHIPMLVVGTVVVGIGTSAPELLVSSLAAASGNRDLGVGNVVGSNIANMTLVLGVAALITTIRVDSRVVRREIPISLAAVLAFAAATVGGLTRVDGVLLLAVLVVILFRLVASGRSRGADALTADVGEFLTEEESRSTGAELLRVAVGLLGTVAGAELMVRGATTLADRLGLSTGFVGVTIVAVGTSLPELFTALAAARRGEDDLIVGNVLGSNLFNSLAVGGVIGVVGPGPIDDRRLAVGGIVLMGLTVAVASALLGRKQRLVRWEALSLLAIYAVGVPLIA